MLWQFKRLTTQGNAGRGLTQKVIEISEDTSLQGFVT